MQVKVLLFIYVACTLHVSMLFAHSSTSVVTGIALIKPPLYDRNCSQPEFKSPLKTIGKCQKKHQGVKVLRCSCKITGFKAHVVVAKSHSKLARPKMQRREQCGKINLHWNIYQSNFSEKSALRVQQSKIIQVTLSSESLY